MKVHETFPRVGQNSSISSELRQAVVESAVKEAVVEAAVSELRRQSRGADGLTWKYFEAGTFAVFLALLLGFMGGMPWSVLPEPADARRAVDLALAGQTCSTELLLFDFTTIRTKKLPWVLSEPIPKTDKNKGTDTMQTPRLGGEKGDLVIGTVPKPGGTTQQASISPRVFYVLRGALIPLARKLRKAVNENRVGQFRKDADEVDRQPSYEVYVLQRGEAVASFEKLSHVKVLKKLEKDFMPWLRRQYDCTDCVACTAFLQKHERDERLFNPNHFDMEAFVTIVVALSEASEHEGGLYVQPGTGARTRRLVALNGGDAVVHQFDLNNGIAVTNGTRYSMVVWISTNRLACEKGKSHWYAKLAKSGDADAQWNLGHLFKRGERGQKQNLTAAEKWYRRSADQGHAGAMNNLALLMEESEASANDKVDDWFRKAAELGEANAQTNLARRLVTARRFTEGARWYAKAASQGIPKAMVALGEVLEERPVAAPRPEAAPPTASGSRGSKAPVATTAEDWYARAATMSFVPAFRALGRLHEARDEPRLSAEWHRRGAELGSTDCMFALARQYLQGKGVNESEALAAKWLRKAADLGRKDAKQVLDLLRS